jgi:Protein of unknown function (DUF3237)/Gamma-glutamyltranspeptidase
MQPTTPTAARPTVGRSVVSTQLGIVAASHPLAARAGVEMLERGGNAVDAASAANATIGLMEPAMNGIGTAAPDVMQKLLAGQAVDPKLVYFRTQPKFETAAPNLQGLVKSLFVGVGERYPNEVMIRFFKVE